MIKFNTREEWLNGAVKAIEPELTKQANLLAGKYKHFHSGYPQSRYQ